MFITALGAIIAFFFSVGAMIGAMITMYSAVANRKREIGTLRALGFAQGRDHDRRSCSSRWCSRCSAA